MTEKKYWAVICIDHQYIASKRKLTEKELDTLIDRYRRYIDLSNDGFDYWCIENCITEVSYGYKTKQEAIEAANEKDTRLFKSLEGFKEVFEK